MNYTVDGLVSSHVEFPNEDEDNIKIFRVEYKLAMEVLGNLFVKIIRLIDAYKY